MNRVVPDPRGSLVPFLHIPITPSAPISEHQRSVLFPSSATMLPNPRHPRHPRPIFLFFVPTSPESTLVVAEPNQHFVESGKPLLQLGATSMEIVWFLLIGLVAGWLAGQLVRGGGFGVVGDIVVGILGALIGGVVFGALGLSDNGSLLGSLIVATVGAILLIVLLRVIKRA